jgi:hypothetical protein
MADKLNPQISNRLALFFAFDIAKPLCKTGRTVISGLIKPIFFAVFVLIAASPVADGASAVLHSDDFKHFIDGFNANDQELYPAAIRNADAWTFLRDNIPLLDCPDRTLEEIYYFRWWTYRKHIKQTPDGFIITEFLPDVHWAGKYNSINCAAALHFYEGRWLHDPKYLDDYAVFWLRKGGSLRSYSFWIADALWNRYLVTGDAREITDLLPDLIANYHEWEKTHLDPNGLFWQLDVRDGMEVPIGDNSRKPGYRPTINSYMFADARAIANIADLLGKPDIAAEFRAKAAAIKEHVQTLLWDKDAQFFKFIPVRPNAKLSAGRELIGFTPWYVNLPDPGFEAAWSQIMDPAGFYAPFGLTTAERRSPDFKLAYTGHECQWNGPSWPFSTSITLTAMANLLNNYHQNVVSNRDYFDILEIYAKSQHLKRADGSVVPWIDENLNPLTGDWMARAIMLTWTKARIPERGKDYNHSTFCDLIISGLIGLRPRTDDTVEVNPLLPAGTWDYFCLDRAPYHGHSLTILYDKTGEHYGRGSGLRVFADGTEIAASPTLSRLIGSLPRH